MKPETGNRIRLGVFVSVAIALFIVVIYFIGNRQHLFSKTIHISGRSLIQVVVVVFVIAV